MTALDQRPTQARTVPVAARTGAHRAPAGRRSAGIRPGSFGAWVDPAGWPLLVAATAAGTLTIGWSYRLSALGADPHLYYAVFWLGTLAVVLPTAWVVVGRRVTRVRRRTALALLGLALFVPKYLRNPFAPAYHDEYAHWHEATAVLTAGRLFQGNPLIPIVEFFPGTSALTAAVSRLGGLSVWSAGELVVLAAHLLALFGIAVLAEAHLGSVRAGGVAAVLYALNPSEMYFDTQYAYESVAIALFVWVLALGSVGARSRGRRRIATTVAALLTAAAAVMTHHLTTVFLLGVLLLVTLVAAIRPGRGGTTRGSATVWAVLLVGTAAMTAAWLLIVARPTLEYLSPYFGGSVRQLVAQAVSRGGSHAEANGRVLLAASAEPLWERALIAFLPLVAGLVCLRGLQILRREHAARASDTLALMGFGLLYFPSVLFLLAPSGAEGARRSWAFSFVGLALIGAMTLTRRAAPGQRGIPAGRRAPIGLLVLALALIGGVGGGLNDPYRFPGGFLWGSDTRSASAEARTAGERLAASVGPVRVVSDQYTALQLIAYGGLDVAAPSTGFPAWLLAQSPSDPPSTLAAMLTGSRYDYLVIDLRMSQSPPFNGANFGQNDPLLGRATPRANLDRLDRVPWASRIMTTPYLRVYRLDLALLGHPVRSGS